MNDKRLIVTQIGWIAGYHFNHAVGMELESNIIFPEAFLRENNGDDMLFPLVLTTEVKF